VCLVITLILIKQRWNILFKNGNWIHICGLKQWDAHYISIWTVWPFQMVPVIIPLTQHSYSVFVPSGNTELDIFYLDCSRYWQQAVHQPPVGYWIATENLTETEVIIQLVDRHVFLQSHLLPLEELGRFPKYRSRNGVLKLSHWAGFLVWNTATSLIKIGS
jgi:hypothetical protein